MFGILKMINVRGYSTAISAMTAETAEVNQMMEGCLKPTTDLLSTVNKWYDNDLISIDNDENFASILIPILSQYPQMNGFIMLDSQEQLFMVIKNDLNWRSYTIKNSIVSIDQDNSCKITDFDQNGKMLSSYMKIIPQDLRDIILFPDNHLENFEK